LRAEGRGLTTFVTAIKVDWKHEKGGFNAEGGGQGYGIQAEGSNLKRKVRKDKPSTWRSTETGRKPVELGKSSTQEG